MSESVEQRLKRAHSAMVKAKAAHEANVSDPKLRAKFNAAYDKWEQALADYNFEHPYA